MRKLLLISHGFPPAGGPYAPASVRLGKFAQYLPEFGWTPVVVSTGLQSYQLLDDGLMPSVDLSVTRVDDPIPPFRGRDRVARWLPSPGQLLPWSIRAARIASQLAQNHNCEVILASSPPLASFLAGYLVHANTHLPLVLDYRDQWTLSPYRVGPGLYRRWDRWLEEKVLRTSTQVVLSTPGLLAEHNVYWGDISPKAICIPNGYDFRDFEGLVPDRLLPRKARDEEIVIRHLGAIYGHRSASLLLVLKALNEYLLGMPEAPVIRLQLVGNVAEEAVHFGEDRSPKLIIERSGNVKRRAALTMELGADVLLLIIGRHSQSDGETTSKIFEYIASGRPILVGGESKTVRQITQVLERVFWLGGDPTSGGFAQFFEWLDKHLEGVSVRQAREDLEQYDSAHDRRSLARGLAEVLSAL
ncbi:MAG: glycosyltransferase [Anaerolineae bacterium]|nr:glycosyltransferase [Anaerolineae bacterium]